MNIEHLDFTYKSRKVQEHYGEASAYIHNKNGKIYDAFILVDKISKDEYNITISASDDVVISEDELEYIAHKVFVEFRLEGIPHAIRGTVNHKGGSSYYQPYVDMLTGKKRK